MSVIKSTTFPGWETVELLTLFPGANLIKTNEAITAAKPKSIKLRFLKSFKNVSKKISSKIVATPKLSLKPVAINNIVKAKKR